MSKWGDGDTILRFAPSADETMRAWWGARERLGGSPGAIRELIASSAITDVSDVLDAVQAPTLVLQRTEDPTARAEAGPRPRGADSGCSARRAPGHRARCRGSTPTPSSTRSRSSSRARVQIVSRIAFWRRSSSPTSSARQRRHSGSVTRHGPGSSSNTTPPCDVSSTAMPERRSTRPATGSSPSSTGLRGRFAARFGSRDAVSRLGLEVRAGLHTGEVERPKGGKPRGIAVNVAARVSGLADRRRGSRDRDDP